MIVLRLQIDNQTLLRNGENSSGDKLPPCLTPDSGANEAEG
jgi:hypothetical protein